MSQPYKVILFYTISILLFRGHEGSNRCKADLIAKATIHVPVPTLN